jgi:hypothetical protein
MTPSTGDAGERPCEQEDAGRRSIESLATRWQGDAGVEDPTLRSLMGDLRGTTALLLGNGDLIPSCIS